MSENFKTIENPRARRRVQFACVGESRTEQHHKNECDINKIMARSLKSGMLPTRGEAGFYGDFTDVEDYQTAVNRVIEAENAFMSLPSSIRKRFGNNPAELLDFMSDENNLDEAVKLGIIPVIEKEIEPVTPEPEPELTTPE